jgi:hypothetical protein
VVRVVPQSGAGPPGDDQDDHDDDRWPLWLSILFILVSSLALWALIIWGVSSLIAPD